MENTDTAAFSSLSSTKLGFSHELMGADPADLAILGGFVQLVHVEVYDHKRKRSEIQHDLANTTMATVVDSDERVVAGAAYGVNEGGVCHLEFLAVAADRRGKGHGRALVDHVRDEAGKSGSSIIAVNAVMSDSFYEKYGFAAVGEQGEQPKQSSRMHVSHEMPV